MLTLIVHWYCKTRNWPLVRSMYESIIEEVELGEKNWSDNFSGYETMLPSINTVINPGATTESASHKIKKNYEVYWCKAFQTNTCELNAPHMAQIKPEEPHVPVLHICAYCWSNFRRRKDHMEVECMAKK